MEIEACARCGQARIIASIEEPKVIAKILAHLHKAALDQAHSGHTRVGAKLDGDTVGIFERMLQQHELAFCVEKALLKLLLRRYKGRVALQKRQSQNQGGRMRRVVLVALAVILVMVGWLYFSTNQHAGEFAPIAPLQNPSDPIAIAPLMVASEEDVVPTPSSEPDEAESPFPQASPPVVPPSEQVGGRVGTFAFYPSVELRTFFFLLSHASSAPSLVEQHQQQMGLTEEEAAKLSEYARTAAEADRKFQAGLQKEICAKKESYRTLEQLGTALNKYTKDVDVYQETLARDARIALGQILFDKVDAEIRRQQPQQLVGADFPVMLVHENRELHTELARVCTAVE